MRFCRKKVPCETPILYGGSVKPQNAAAIFAMPDVDGGLIGGASLVAKDFLDIVKAAARKDEQMDLDQRPRSWLHVLVALAIIGLVLLQHGKGADMGSGFGGGASGSLFGATGSANFLSRTTAVLATIFFLLSLGARLRRDQEAGRGRRQR